MTKSHLQHVALVMDGNRRWARARGLSALSGYRRGAQVLKDVVRACPKLGIPYLTVYVFSSENWQRPVAEVAELMGLLEEYLRVELEALHAAKVRLRVIGCRKALSKSIQGLIQKAETLTSGNSGVYLQMALSYGSRDEIVRAMMVMGEKIQAKTLHPHDITEEVLSQHLDTADVPDPCLLIRTGGEKRLSNYLLWQLAYTEFVFLDKFWPDFQTEDLERALRVYSTRERRFGYVA